MGGRMTLMYDAASELKTFADAVYVGKACDEAGYAWYETRSWTPDGLHMPRASSRSMCRTPLLLTEHVRGLERRRHG